MIIFKSFVLDTDGEVLEEPKNAECAVMVRKDELEEVIDREVVGVEEVIEDEVQGYMEEELGSWIYRGWRMVLL